MKTELPILMNFTGAKRHDSINFLYAVNAFDTHGADITPTNLCLNSAHDNLPTYRLLEHWEINALIVLNKRRGTMDSLPEDISLDKDGHPSARQASRCATGAMTKIRAINSAAH